MKFTNSNSILVLFHKSILTSGTVRVCVKCACMCACFCLALSVFTLHFVCPFASHAQPPKAKRRRSMVGEGAREFISGKRKIQEIEKERERVCVATPALSLSEKQTCAAQLQSIP